MKKAALKIGTVLAGLAIMVTTLNANSTCICYAHQPKMPQTAKKLRRF